LNPGTVVSVFQNTMTVGGLISNASTTAAELNKVGGGALLLNAANTFSGNLIDMVGTVTLANAHTYSRATTVGMNATLNVNSFGTVASTSAINVSVGATMQIDN